jgi:hypothetical protein
VGRRREGERAGELDADAAVGAGREPGGVGQLAEPVSIEPHGEDLIVAVMIGAEGVEVSPPRAEEMERVQRRFEDDGVCDRISSKWVICRSPPPS